MGISSSMISALKKEEKTAMNNNISLILHIHEYHCWQSLLILLFMNKHTKIISQHHGARAPFKNLMKYKRLFLIFPYILFMQILENSLLKKINIFYALTDEEIEYLRKRCKNSEIKFQTAGIDNFYFKNVDKKDARNKLCLNLNKKYVLYLGRIKSSKGMKELIDAMEYFKDKKIELLIIGEGSDLNMYKNYAKEKSINNISFLGPKYGMEKKMFLSACDCLILPSYTEGAPVVLMEALASNLPAVATNIGGIPKIIRDGKDGIIIKPHSKKDIINALVRILKWTKKNLKQYTEKYKWSIIIKNTVKDYRRLIKH
jgi:glycosyltransferase involved in cell wall biosynthesis